MGRLPIIKIDFLIVVVPSHRNLCDIVSLFCGFAIPFDGFFFILFDTITTLIAISQCVLCLCISLLCRFKVPLYCFIFISFYSNSKKIAPAEFILCFWTLLLSSTFIQFNGFILIFFSPNAIIITCTQRALCLCIALFGSLFVPHNGIFRIFLYTNTVLVTPCHFQLCLWASVITGRNHVLLKRHLGIADLLKITGILQVVLLGFLLRFLLRFLAQTKALHAIHKFSLFVLRPIELKAVHGIFLTAEIHSLDFSPQTVPIHTASRRFKPFFNRFCLDGIRDFHLLPIHTDRLQFIRKTYFHLNFAHNDSLPMYL